MKNVLSVLIVLFCSTLLSAQYSPSYTCVGNKKNSADRCPILKSTSYVAILDGNIEKDKLIESTKSLLKREGLEITDENTHQFDDNLNRLSQRVETYGGMFMGSVGFGSKLAQSPVLARYDINLTFNNENQVMVEFTNFETRNLVVVNDKNEFTFTDELEEISPPLYALFMSFSGDITPKTTPKETSTELFSIKGNPFKKKGLKTTNNIKETSAPNTDFKNRDLYRKNIREEMEICNNEAATNPNVIWVLDKDLVNYKWRNNRYYKDQISNAVANGEVIGITKDRFRDYFMKNFNYYINEIARATNSKISEVGLDGNAMYTNIDGDLVPTDEKERKKWKNEGTQF